MRYFSNLPLAILFLRFLDEDDSLKYRIAEVSNNGKRIFYVNPVTGIAYLDKKIKCHLFNTLNYLNSNKKQ